MNHAEHDESIGSMLASIAAALREVSDKLDVVAARVQQEVPTFPADEDLPERTRIHRLESWAFHASQDISRLSSRLDALDGGDTPPRTGRSARTRREVREAAERAAAEAAEDARPPLDRRHSRTDHLGDPTWPITAPPIPRGGDAVSRSLFTPPEEMGQTGESSPSTGRDAVPAAESNGAAADRRHGSVRHNDVVDEVTLAADAGIPDERLGSADAESAIALLVSNAAAARSGSAVGNGARNGPGSTAARITESAPPPAGGRRNGSAPLAAGERRNGSAEDSAWSGAAELSALDAGATRLPAEAGGRQFAAEPAAANAATDHAAERSSDQDPDTGHRPGAERRGTSAVRDMAAAQPITRTSGAAEHPAAVGTNGTDPAPTRTDRSVIGEASGATPMNSVGGHDAIAAVDRAVGTGLAGGGNRTGTAGVLGDTAVTGDRSSGPEAAPGAGIGGDRGGAHLGAVASPAGPAAGAADHPTDIAVPEIPGAGPAVGSGAWTTGRPDTPTSGETGASSLASTRGTDTPVRAEHQAVAPPTATNHAATVTDSGSGTDPGLLADRQAVEPMSSQVGTAQPGDPRAVGLTTGTAGVSTAEADPRGAGSGTAGGTVNGITWSFADEDGPGAAPVRNGYARNGFTTDGHDRAEVTGGQGRTSAAAPARLSAPKNPEDNRPSAPFGEPIAPKDGTALRDSTGITAPTGSGSSAPDGASAAAAGSTQEGTPGAGRALPVGQRTPSPPVAGSVPAGPGACAAFTTPSESGGRADRVPPVVDTAELTAEPGAFAPRDDRADTGQPGGHAPWAASGHHAPHGSSLEDRTTAPGGLPLREDRGHPDGSSQSNGYVQSGDQAPDISAGSRGRNGLVSAGTDDDRLPASRNGYGGPVEQRGSGHSSTDGRGMTGAVPDRRAASPAELDPPTDRNPVGARTEPAPPTATDPAGITVTGTFRAFDIERAQVDKLQAMLDELKRSAGLPPGPRDVFAPPTDPR
ncbi:hypothetical protein [Nocardia rhizosphaerae]|uniref:Uncharacterized protein n=1 Tax=Nocardia rhizosphaerae TaxID=1691571 RepID=A0ABV8L7Y4_9NOCA